MSDPIFQRKIQTEICDSYNKLIKAEEVKNMGWAKYAEDINEIVSERMNLVIEIITAVPLIACPVEVSIEVKSDKEQVAPKVKYEDKTFYCWDCGKVFIFSAGEQWFYEKKGLHQPKRCKACRETNKIKLLAFR